MTKTYARQSSYLDGDVILAEHTNVEFDELVDVMNEVSGHDHDGTVGGGAPVPLIERDTSGVYINVDSTPKIVFKVNDVIVNESTEQYFAPSTTLGHTPNGGSEIALGDYLIDLDVRVGDSAQAAIEAAEAADRAENAASNLGISTYISEGGSYTIPNAVEFTSLILEGNGTIHLPSLLVKGRRYTIRMVSSAIETTGIIVNPLFTIIGNKLTLSPGDGILVEPGELLVLEAISTTELEII